MFRRSFHIASSLVLLLAVSSTAAAEEFRVPLMKKAPKIDGRIEPAEWAQSAGFDSFARDGKLQQRRVQAFVGATRTHLLVAVRSQLPEEGELRAAIDRDSLKAVFDDAVEVFINPTPDAAKQVNYQFLVNSLGKGGYNVHTLGGAKAESAWRGNWQQAHGFHGEESVRLRLKAWHFECAIPIASMPAAGKGRKATDGAWKINLTRDWKSPWEWSSLSGEGGTYAFKGYRFRFVESGAPAVRFGFVGDPVAGSFAGGLTVGNPADGPLNLMGSLVLVRNNMPTLRSQDRFQLKGGQTKQLQVKVGPADPTQHYTLHMLVKSADGKVTFYDRKVAWQRGEPLKWVAGKKAKPAAVDFRFAYYPYRNRMRVLADISGLPAGAKLDKLTAEVRDRLRRKSVKVVDFPVGGFRSGRQERTFDLPPLSGHYEIGLKAQGRGVPAGEIVKTFERKVFPWEHLPTGRSTKVYPPFTPIEVKGDFAKKVRTVLREHTLSDLGLWDQVEAASSHTGIRKTILAAPMRYVARVDGKPTAVLTDPIKLVEVKPHVVRTRSTFTAGALKAASTNTWDYDGTMKVELTLLPTNGKRVDALRLEIPLADAAAPLIHANGDRIRIPVARRVPEGEGAIWDATKVAYDDFQHNFCPYVYVGSPVRGICWFAENDAGWSWDPKTPNLDLHRKGEVLTLRIHLINQPIVIDKPRRIVFGLLAAPVKPRLVAPGKGRHWWRYRYYRDKYTLLGTDINWMSLGTCGSVYPAGKDLYLWEMLARGNREKLSREEVEGLEKWGRKYFQPYGEAALKSWRAHVHHNLRSRYGQKMLFYYNRASYQAAEEFETFKDEWCLTDYRSIGKGPGKGEIKIVPSASYIDHALYWYARSFEVGGNQGVYWDNFFIAPSFNTEMTDAYRGPDGRIVPAAGIWALRELARRTFVMMNERGMLPITFPHMTSFNPLPMMAFCTVQYDWEWKYSLGDVQDRHSRELILLMSTGDLAGVWPVPLSDHGKLAGDVWTQRTFTAVRLVHELDGYGGCGAGYIPAHKENHKLLEPILAVLDEPDLKVYRYWDDRPQPVAATDPDLPAVVYEVPGKQYVVAVVSYADRDKTCTMKILQKKIALPAPLRITDAITGRKIPLDGAAVSFPLKKHDVRVLCIETEQGR